MPTFTITAPDGKEYDVTAPDGASEYDVLKYAQSNYKLAPKAQPMSTTEKVAFGMADPIHGGAQFLTNKLPSSVVQAGNRFNNWLADKTGLVAKLPEGGVDQQVREREQAYEQRRKVAGETGVDWARIAGNVASPVNIGLGAAMPLGKTTAAKMLATGLGGEASAVLNPVGEGDFNQEKTKQLLMGLGSGAVAPLVGNAVSRVVSPKASLDPKLALLKSEGVSPTIGQSLGGRWNAAEEKLMSVPIMGDMIANARGASLEQFNKAAINRATAPINEKVAKAGQEGVKEAGDKLSGAYDAALNAIRGVHVDPQGNTELLTLQRNAQGLVPSMRDKFFKEWGDKVTSRFSPNGSLQGATYKTIDSDLSSLASKYQKSSVASEQELGDAFAELRAILQRQAMRNDPNVAAQLKAADTGWANLVRVEGAAKAGKNAEGIFTPAQLNMAIQQAEDSVRKRSVSRGTALMQDLGNAGQSVLGNKVPNSFTTDRALLGGGLLGSWFVNPAIPLSLLGGAGLYAPGARNAMAALVNARPQVAEPIAEGIRYTMPALAPAAAQVGLGLLK